MSNHSTGAVTFNSYGQVTVSRPWVADQVYDASLFAQEVYKYSSPMSGLLTPSVRWIAKDSKSYLLERKPSRMTIMYVPGTKNTSALVPVGNETLYDLPIPWTQYFVRFNDTKLMSPLSVYVFFRKNSLTSLDEVPYYSMLPNTFASGLACLGNDFQTRYASSYDLYRKVGGTPPLGIIMSMALNMFWEGLFNSDMGLLASMLPDEFYSRLESLMDSTPLLKYWESKTIEDMLAVDYLPLSSSDTFKSMCDSFETEKSNYYDGIVNFVAAKGSACNQTYF